MSVKLSKKERRDERRHERVRRVATELQSALLSFRSSIHEMFEDWESKGTTLGGIDDPLVLSREERGAIAAKGAGKRLRPFVRGEVLEPLEPIKIGEKTKLVIKDTDRAFKEPIVSPKMQKNLRILELRLDAKGHLYSPKSFDPTWNWQTQAIWLRTVGLGYLAISKKLGKSNNTVKSMFERLGITKFFARASKLDYATIGYRGSDTPSGWRAIKMGGSSGMQYLPHDMVVNPETGLFEPLYKVNFSVGEHVLTSASTEYKVQTQPFDLEKHTKEVKGREKKARKRKVRIILEQKTTEIENLQKHIEEGFDPETGGYKKEQVVSK
jgi:hypothetical protein